MRTEQGCGCREGGGGVQCAWGGSGQVARVKHLLEVRAGAPAVCRDVNGCSRGGPGTRGAGTQGPGVLGARVRCGLPGLAQ